MAVSERQRALLLGGVGVAALLVLYLVGLDAAFGNSDEAIYAVFVREMHQRGDYLRLFYDGAELVQRPAWSVSLYGLVARVVPGEFGIRLLPALLTLGAALMAGELVRRRSGRLDLGFATACLAAGIPSVFLFGRLCMSDPPYVVAALGALGATVAAQRDARWLTWAGVALGAAVGFKSVAGALPGAALAPWLVVAFLRHRRAAVPGLGRRVALGVLALVALAAPFYVINYARFGQHFIDVHFGEILGARARGDLPGIGLEGGPAGYLVHIWRADGPAYTLLLLGGPVAAAVLAIRRRDAVLGIAASYTLGVLAMLSVLGTRLPHYLLVVYPAAAACVGLVLAAAVDHFSRRVKLPRAAYKLVLPALAFLLVVRAAGQDSFDESSVPSLEARQLGRVAKRVVSADQPIYTFDWYAPALGYYADRRWRLLTSYRSMETIVGSIETFRAAGTVSYVPPWPTGRFYVASSVLMLDRAPEFKDAKVIDHAGDMLLLEVEVP